VENEGQSFGRGERLEHDQQCETNRVGKQRLVLGIAALGWVDDRVSQVHVERLLAPSVACAEHVQRDAATTVVSQPPRFDLLGSRGLLQLSERHSQPRETGASGRRPPRWGRDPGIARRAIPAIHVTFLPAASWK
jgi:hypothetical protein